MTPAWGLSELEVAVYHASETLRRADRWDVVAKIEEAARTIREAVALECRPAPALVPQRGCLASCEAVTPWCQTYGCLRAVALT